MSQQRTQWVKVWEAIKRINTRRPGIDGETAFFMAVNEVESLEGLLPNIQPITEMPVKFDARDFEV